MTSTSLGTQLKALRLRRGWSVAQLARAAEYTEGAIYHIESGDREPMSSTLAALARALDVSADELLGLEPTSDFRPAEDVPVRDVLVRLGLPEELLESEEKWGAFINIAAMIAQLPAAVAVELETFIGGVFWRDQGEDPPVPEPHLPAEEFRYSEPEESTGTG